MKHIRRRNVVNYFELPEQWQKEAVSNLDDLAEEALYLEPLDHHYPAKHVLYDLTECMYVGKRLGLDKCVIGISNNSAMLLVFSRCGDQVVRKFI